MLQPVSIEALPQHLRETLLSKEFSGGVSIVLDGQVVLDFSGGFANREKRIPNRVLTQFGVASLGKMFTAVCIARLIEVGQCAYDTPLIEVLPGLRRRFDERITLDGLLAHTSGLGDYIDDDAALPFAGMPVDEFDAPEKFLPYVLQVSRHKPGTFRYSSAGYILLGLAIETLTGLDYVAAMQRCVIEPACMMATQFRRQNHWPSDAAIGYLPDGRTNIGHLPIIGGPDGGILTTAHDLRCFAEALRSARLVTPETRRRLFEPLSFLGGRNHYGRGFYRTTILDRTWFGHTGSDPGVSARVAFDPVLDSSIVVLCNVESIAFNVFRAVVDWLESRTQRSAA